MKTILLDTSIDYTSWDINEADSIKMDDIPKNANGLQIVVHETKPVAQVHMFIDGKYTHWVEYDISQMKQLAEVAYEKLREMMEKKDAKEL